MSYPSPDDPDYCPGSEQKPRTYDPELQWQRCDKCRRPIVAKPNGTLFPHVNNIKRARRRDDVQESLIAYGHNKRSTWAPVTDPEYAEAGA